MHAYTTRMSTTPHCKRRFKAKTITPKTSYKNAVAHFSLLHSAIFNQTGQLLLSMYSTRVTHDVRCTYRNYIQVWVIACVCVFSNRIAEIMLPAILPYGIIIQWLIAWKWPENIICTGIGTSTNSRFDAIGHCTLWSSRVSEAFSIRVKSVDHILTLSPVLCVYAFVFFSTFKWIVFWNCHWVVKRPSLSL